jgi:hypothetical protein
MFHENCVCISYFTAVLILRDLCVLHFIVLRASSVTVQHAIRPHIVHTGLFVWNY